MGKPFRRLIAAASAALALGIGSAAWANAFFDLPSCSLGKHVYLRVAVIQPGTNI